MGDHLFKICRVCGSDRDTLVLIFDEEGVENAIEDKIEKYLPIKVNYCTNYRQKLIKESLFSISFQIKIENQRN